MKTNMLALTLLAAVAAPAFAQDSTVTLANVPAQSEGAQVTVRQLADETGLTPQRVRMVVGPHSGYAEYRITFNRVQRQFKSALGEERYNDLMAGRRIELYNQPAIRVADTETTRTAGLATAP